MEYFISHIGYILIAGVILGVLAFSAVFFAEKSAQMNENEEREFVSTGEIGCGFNCSSCMRFDSCSREGKKQRQ